jgi:hypothetical protein
VCGIKRSSRRWRAGTENPTTGSYDKSVADEISVAALREGRLSSQGIVRLELRVFDPNASKPAGRCCGCPKGFLPNSDIVKSGFCHGWREGSDFQDLSYGPVDRLTGACSYPLSCGKPPARSRRGGAAN